MMVKAVDPFKAPCLLVNVVDSLMFDLRHIDICQDAELALPRMYSFHVPPHKDSRVCYFSIEGFLLLSLHPNCAPWLCSIMEVKSISQYTLQGNFPQFT